MHIKTSCGDPLFERSKMDQIEKEVYFPMSNEQIENEKELERFKHEFQKSFIQPHEMIQLITNDKTKLKDIYEGFSSGILKLKNQDISQEDFSAMANRLNLLSNQYAYEQFIDENGVKFLIEKSLGTKIKFGNIKQVIDDVIQPYIVKVSLEEIKG